MNCRRHSQRWQGRARWQQKAAGLTFAYTLHGSGARKPPGLFVRAGRRRKWSLDTTPVSCKMRVQGGRLLQLPAASQSLKIQIVFQRSLQNFDDFLVTFERW